MHEKFFFRDCNRKESKIVLIDLKVTDTSECEAGNKVYCYAIKLCRILPQPSCDKNERGTIFCSLVRKRERYLRIYICS